MRGRQHASERQGRHRHWGRLRIRRGNGQALRRGGREGDRRRPQREGRRARRRGDRESRGVGPDRRLAEIRDR